MALTVEEKIKRLEDMAEWDLYKPEHKNFLKDIARNIDPERAYANAYPDIEGTRKHNARFGAIRLCRFLSIKRAFEAIGYATHKETLTKKDVLQDLSQKLRKQGLDDELYVKLVNIYSRMQGWNKPEPEEEDEEATPLEKVLEAERKRRNGEKDKD